MTSDVGKAMTAAFDDQRRTDLCRLEGVPRLVVDFLGPTSRFCAAGYHTDCPGRFASLTLKLPCMCPCHATPQVEA